MTIEGKVNKPAPGREQMSEHIEDLSSAFSQLKELFGIGMSFGEMISATTSEEKLVRNVLMWAYQTRSENAVDAESLGVMFLRDPTHIDVLLKKFKKQIQDTVPFSPADEKLRLLLHVARLLVRAENVPDDLIAKVYSFREKEIRAMHSVKKKNAVSKGEEPPKNNATKPTKHGGKTERGELRILDKVEVSIFNLRREGLSAQQIAERLKSEWPIATKNAVIGCAHRAFGSLNVDPALLTVRTSDQGATEFVYERITPTKKLQRGPRKEHAQIRKLVRLARSRHEEDQ